MRKVAKDTAAADKMHRKEQTFGKQREDLHLRASLAGRKRAHDVACAPTKTNFSDFSTGL